MEVSLILRIPYLIFEGDSLILRCQEKNNHSLTKVTYYKNSKSFSAFNQSSDVVIPQASLSNRSSYHCTAFKNIVWKKSNEVTLDIHDPGVILLGQARAQELQISKFWMEDSGLYWCKVETVSLSVSKQSRPIRMSVMRILISGVHMEVQPHGGHIMEGQKLVLLCSVIGGSGTITFSWHRKDTEASLGKKIQHSLVAEFVFSAVRESDAGKYYCTADNNSSLIPSHSVTITVRRNGKDSLAVGITMALISAFGLTVVLLIYFKKQKKSETSVDGDLVYSEVWSTQQGKEDAADASKKPPDDKDCSVTYSVVKKTETLGDSTGNSS
ncbi:Fc receptor-like protein 4 [Monodelphis domestica]|uniref:Fc receptor-like protein 4 n=1 Tax=Monodelphis domestica TaxID=13616 RepID=UPI0024E1EC58|nr:Fc receptor-like protein 4 [Monodelphis domestica]